jgi:uncharacterized protein (UPF0332 family)
LKKNIYYKVTSAYKIREKSDYDDFFIASKEDAETQIKNAEFFLEKVAEFLALNFISLEDEVNK